MNSVKHELNPVFREAELNGWKKIVIKEERICCRKDRDVLTRIRSNELFVKWDSIIELVHPPRLNFEIALKDPISNCGKWFTEEGCLVEVLSRQEGQ